MGIRTQVGVPSFGVYRSFTGYRSVHVSNIGKFLHEVLPYTGFYRRALKR